MSTPEPIPPKPPNKLWGRLLLIGMGLLLLAYIIPTFFHRG